MQVKTRMQELRSQIRETRQEMKDNGIRRMSCFNGGHSPESYRLNALMFRLELELKDIKGGQHEDR